MSDSSSSDGEAVDGMPFSMHDLNITDLIFEDSSFARGAFGRMVKADYFGVTVCVKILKKQRKKELSKFIYREMAALKTLSHPNLVQFIGLTERGNEFCLVTEYISGGTLRKLLKDRAINIPWPIRVQIAVDIASAMTYLHSRKIMHRDLKSKNLLVGDNWKIKICDFGFARSVHDKKKAAALTFCGTEEYMAPEVIFGMEYDERAEVYSYGLLLCEIMTRQKVEETVPRTSNTNYGLDHQEFTSHVPKDCPIELLQLAFLCTEFEPKNRPEFREITQLLREIKHNVNSAPVVFGQYVAAQTTNATQPARSMSPAQTAVPVTPVPAHVQTTNAAQPAVTVAREVPPAASHAAPVSPAAHVSPAAPVSPTPALPRDLPPSLVSPTQSPTMPPAQQFKLPPPISLSSDDLLVNYSVPPSVQEKASSASPNHSQNDGKPGSSKTGPSEAPRRPAPIPFRRSPSAPIPMPVPGKPPAANSQSNLRQSTTAQEKVVSKEVPASAKLGRPAPAKTAPATFKSTIVPKTAPSYVENSNQDNSSSSRPSSNFTPARPSQTTTNGHGQSTTNGSTPSASSLPSSPPSSSVRVVKSAATAPVRTGTAGHPTTPAKPSYSGPAKSGMVPVLPKVPAVSVTSPSPNGSPRSAPISAKDRPASPISKPAPPTRTGRPVLPSEIAEKKKPQVP